MRRGDCMAANLCPPNTQAGTSHSAISIGSRKDWDKYLQERLCRIPLAPSTSIIIVEITESPVDSEALSPKKGQAMLTVEDFTPLALALPAVIELSPGFIQKGTPVVPAIRGFDPLILPKPI